MSFGELVKKYRLAQDKSLRRFCEEHDYDPGNQSKLERNPASGIQYPASSTQFTSESVWLAARCRYHHHKAAYKQP
jgi:hypothetical protein